MAFYDKFVIKPGTKVDLDKFDPDDTAGWKKEDAKARTAKNFARLSELQELLYAEHKQKFLMVLQAMDAGGKDGAVSHIGGAMNPQGVRVVSFKAPTKEELDHDFLWRVDKEMPKKGEVVIFNRSHYEDVLIARVKNLVPKEVWQERYGIINDFEKRQAASGTHMVKFYLHISQEEQWARFGEREGNPDKQWKLAGGTPDGKGNFNGGDLLESKEWPKYRKAFNAALTKCSTEAAPWVVVPANHKWFRDLVISSIMVDQLEGLKMKFPASTANSQEVLAKNFQGKEWKKLRDIFEKARQNAANDSVKQGKTAKPEHKRAQQQKKKHG